MEGHVVIGVDSRDILQEIKSATLDWLATCMKCKMVGHFVKVCITKEEDSNRPKKGNIRQVLKDDDLAFILQTSGKERPRTNAWWARIDNRDTGIQTFQANPGLTKLQT